MSAIKKCLIILIINAILLAAAIVCWRLNDVKTNSNNVIIVIPPSTDGDAELKEFTAVRFEDMTVIYDGLEHEIVLSGALPNGTVVEYASNTGVETGVYNARATIKKPGYKTLVLQAKLIIEPPTTE